MAALEKHQTARDKQSPAKLPRLQRGGWHLLSIFYSGQVQSPASSHILVSNDIST
jgi:hypothetical protein